MRTRRLTYPGHEFVNLLVRRLELSRLPFQLRLRLLLRGATRLQVSAQARRLRVVLLLLRLQAFVNVTCKHSKRQCRLPVRLYSS